MFLYAVVPQNENMVAWQYRITTRDERENGDAGHYWVIPHQREAEGNTIEVDRQVYWLPNRQEAETLADKLVRMFPGTMWMVMMVDRIYNAHVVNTTVRRHVEGQGILPT